MNKTIFGKMLPLVLLLALQACNQQPAPAAPVAPPPVAPPPVTSATSVSYRLLQDPIEPVVLELPSQAFPAWRQAGGKPALLLLANDPFLAAIPDELATAALALAANATPEELAAFASYRRAAPRLLPFQSVRVALQSGWFSRVVWVFPSGAEGTSPDLGLFRQQLTERQILTADEAAGLQVEDGVIRGTVLGAPFQAGPLSAGQLPTERLQLHVDLSYFTPQYKDEVRTPVFEILRQFAADLAAANLQAAGVTLSYSTDEGLLPLDLRFLIANLASLVRAPERLQSPLASPWKERGEALYLATFLQTEKVLEKNLQALAAAPDDPAVHFDLYRSYRAVKNGAKALEHLALAVGLDKGYAMEYMNLAATARERGEPRDALEMLELARRALPEDPFIPLLILEGQLAGGDKASARTLVRSLQGLPWSPVYFPGLPGRLQQLAEQAEK